jgi:hypothetical protein
MVGQWTMSLAAQQTLYLHVLSFESHLLVNAVGGAQQHIERRVCGGGGGLAAAARRQRCCQRRASPRVPPRRQRRRLLRQGAPAGREGGGEGGDEVRGSRRAGVAQAAAQIGWVGAATPRPSAALSCQPSGLTARIAAAARCGRTAGWSLQGAHRQGRQRGNTDCADPSCALAKRHTPCTLGVTRPPQPLQSLLRSPQPLPFQPPPGFQSIPTIQSNPFQSIPIHSNPHPG